MCNLLNDCEALNGKRTSGLEALQQRRSRTTTTTTTTTTTAARRSPQVRLDPSSASFFPMCNLCLFAFAYFRLKINRNQAGNEFPLPLPLRRNQMRKHTDRQHVHVCMCLCVCVQFVSHFCSWQFSGCENKESLPAANRLQPLSLCFSLSWACAWATVCPDIARIVHEYVCPSASLCPLLYQPFSVSLFCAGLSACRFAGLSVFLSVCRFGCCAARPLSASACKVAMLRRMRRNS